MIAFSVFVLAGIAGIYISLWNQGPNIIVLSVIFVIDGVTLTAVMVWLLRNPGQRTIGAKRLPPEAGGQSFR